MLKLSSNTLLLIATVLENDGYAATEEELHEALDKLFGGARNVDPADAVVDSELQLREGEEYLVYDTDERELETFPNRERLDNRLSLFADRSVESGYNREIDDMAEVFIIRKRVYIDTVTSVTLR